MPGSTAVVSSYMLFHSDVLLGQPLVPVLKRAAVLCENIYIEAEGLGEPGGALENMFINSAFGGNAEKHDLVQDKHFKKMLLRKSDFSKSERNQILGEFDLGGDPVYAQALDFVRHMDDSFFEPLAHPRRGVDHKARGSVAIQVATDIQLPNRMKSVLPDAVGILSPLHKNVLSGLKLPFLEEEDPMVQLAAIDVVDYGALSWHEILRLRKSAFITEFRAKLALVEQAGGVNMQQELWGDLWKFAAENKPAPGKTLLSGILANLPIGPVNPFSVGMSLADTAKADTMRRQFGWLYFVMDSNSDLLPADEESSEE